MPRLRHLATVALAALALLTIPARAGAAPPDTPPTTTTTSTPTPTPDTILPAPERLRLACRGVGIAPQLPADVAHYGILCKWSPSQLRAFAAYQLVRSDGNDRIVVFKTGDRAQTQFFDHHVQPGKTYVYLVEVLNRYGRVIGLGGPVKATAPPTIERLHLSCALLDTFAYDPTIGCRWSASHHPAARGYLLYRSIDGGPRQIVYKGGLDQTWFFDTEIRPGHRFTYVVAAVDADGRFVGKGGPVVVGVPG